MTSRTAQEAATVRRTVPAPFGPVHVVATDDAIVAIHWCDDVPDVPPCDSPHPVLDRAAEQLAEYFAGTRSEFDLPLAPRGTPFQQRAWAALREIPYGTTISYGEQARRLGDPNKSRAIGAANGRNPIPIVVPCHRVIGTNGKLTGFAGGLDVKAWLLAHERRTSGQTLA